jgi:hypothetical protein
MGILSSVGTQTTGSGARMGPPENSLPPCRWQPAGAELRATPDRSESEDALKRAADNNAPRRSD